MSTGGKKGGYWMANSFEEIKAFVDGEFRSRSLDQLHTGKRVLDAGRRKFGGQQGIWEESTRMGQRYQEAISILED